jgi:hypothetical protein
MTRQVHKSSSFRFAQSLRSAELLSCYLNPDLRPYLLFSSLMRLIVGKNANA